MDIGLEGQPAFDDITVRSSSIDPKLFVLHIPFTTRVTLDLHPPCASSCSTHTTAPGDGGCTTRAAT